MEELRSKILEEFDLENKYRELSADNIMQLLQQEIAKARIDELERLIGRHFKDRLLQERIDELALKEHKEKL